MNEDTLFVVMIYVLGLGPPLAIVASRVYYFITEERKSERESVDHRIDVAIEARQRVVSRKRIPAAVQEEIDQTPEWWDREFRRLSGEPEPPRILTSPGGIGYIPAVNGEGKLISERWGRIVEQRLTDLQEVKVGSARDYPVRTYSPGGWIDPAPPLPAELVTEDVIYATLEPEKKFAPNRLTGGRKYE